CGTPFEFRLDYGRAINPKAKVVQIDLDGNELGKNRRLDVAIDGDSGVVLDQLLAAIKEKRSGGGLAQVRAAEDKSRAKMTAEIDSDVNPPNPLRVCAEVGKRLGKNDIVIGDGGDFVATGRQKIPVIPVIGNDAAWTQIRRGQVDLYGVERAVATGLEYTRYDKV